MNSLRDKRILLGISGGIAAYKTPQLVRLLRQAQADVQVVMTRSAHQFVTATSLQAVSGRAVRDTLWDAAAEASMGHIELARWADLILIAPASADLISRLAQGRADDLLCAVCLASQAPVWAAPAMNTVMFEAPATRRNLTRLMEDGVEVLGPDSGEQACGETGPGRMVEPEQIVSILAATDIKMTSPRHASGASQSPDKRGVVDVSLVTTPVSGSELAGRKVVITAGPTREAIDPVRYISNLSSGKQGYAMAEAARDAGASVTLISGPTNLPPPRDVSLVEVETALEMHAASLEHAQGCDLFIGVAAVADYRPQAVASQKIKKNPDTHNPIGMTLELVENPDIIASVAALSDPPVVIGFAAETHKTLEHARLKLARKGIDAIVVNDVSRAEIGFNSDDNAATFIWAAGEDELAKQNKYSLACEVLHKTSAIFVRQLAHTNPEDMAN